jgi:type III pantothenate kinase
MTRRIAINIGNSRASCGFFREGKLAESWHYPTANIETAAATIAQRAQSETDIEIAFCSVVPSATEKLRHCLLEFEVDAFQVTSKNQAIIQGGYSTIGADRVATAAAAVRRYPEHEVLLVFDFGTATTLTVVDKSGKFLGGFITLGLGKTFDALHQFTAQLPDLKQMLGTPIKDGLGTETEEAIIGGSVLGHVGLFEHWLERSRKMFASDVTVVATGGYARYLSPYTDKIDYLEPNLTLIGINLIAEEAKVLRGRA